MDDYDLDGSYDLEAEISDIGSDEVDISGEEVGEIDMGYDIDNMSLDELKDLRAELTETDIDDSSDMEDITSEEGSDYSFHWDGGPTHDTEWDDIGDSSPDILEKVLKR